MKQVEYQKTHIKTESVVRNHDMVISSTVARALTSELRQRFHPMFGYVLANGWYSFDQTLQRLIFVFSDTGSTRLSWLYTFMDIEMGR